MLFLGCAQAEEGVAPKQYYTVEMLVFSQDETSALTELYQGRAALPQPDPKLEGSVDLFRDTSDTRFSYLKQLPPDLLKSPLRYIDGEWNSDARQGAAGKTQVKLNQAFFSSIYEGGKQNATASGNQLEPGSLPAPREFVPLSASHWSLTKVARSIDREPGLRVLAHLAWNQHADPFGGARRVRVHNRVEILPPRRNTIAPSWLEFEASTPSPKPATRFQLDGVASLSEGTFLHVELDLVYRQRLSGDGPRAHLVDGKPLPYLSHHLRVRRRLTRDTLNYLDSRHLGAIVVVRKWPPAPAP